MNENIEKYEVPLTINMIEYLVEKLDNQADEHWLKIDWKDENEHWPEGTEELLNKQMELDEELFKYLRTYNPDFLNFYRDVKSFDEIEKFITDLNKLRLSVRNVADDNK